MNNKIKQTITDTLKNYEIEKIILFGSRARGDNKEDSDYDVLVIVKENINWETREDISSVIRKKLAEDNIDIEILIRASSYVEEAKNEIGNVINYAVEEGIEM